ncbi:hypothetical protein [Rhodoplanes elegans]|uniref:hypothetical protein n=1 Tax=Rhodoplanes elegans TaxID=29408 RepID=UPI0011B94C6B|nr:hypothetical protein [Rhodoplanes elegans]
MKQLFGYIFDWCDPRTDAPLFLDALKQATLRDIRPYGKLDGSGVRRWEVMHFYSNRPLLGEEPVAFDPAPKYRYRLYVRVNSVTGSVILAASRYAITDAAVEIINRALTPDLRRRVLNINDIVQHLFRRDVQKYSVTYLMADVPGHKPLVNTIAIHGDDIGTSTFLLDERKSFTARQVGVRPIQNKLECCRFGNSGSIQFWLEQSNALERFLAYAYENKYYIA